MKEKSGALAGRSVGDSLFFCHVMMGGVRALKLHLAFSLRFYYDKKEIVQKGA